MEPPVPPPRSAKKNDECTSSNIRRNYSSDVAVESPDREKRNSVIKVSAEVHSANRSIFKSGPEQYEKRVEKKRRKVKRKGTFTMKEKRNNNADKLENTGESEQIGLIQLKSSSKLPAERRGSLTETLSESDSGKIKLIPLRPISGRRRVPTGSATETLSEDSETSPVSPKLVPTLPPVPPRRKSLPLSQIIAVKGRPRSAVVEQSAVEENNGSPPPVPAPRTSISKSIEQIGSPYCTSSSMDYQDTAVFPNTKLRKHKKKRKLRDAKEPESKEKKSNQASSTESINPASAKPSPGSVKKKKTEEMACITVHSCEPLQVKHFNGQHIVRIHVMDLTTGKYKRSALGKMDIQPVNTSHFDYKEHRSAMPTWEEDLFLMEPLTHIVSVDTMLLFEVIDSQKDEVIAWAFLKPVAANGVLNTGKTLRLQLYKAGKPVKDNTIPKGFQWWSRAKYSNYKSTLFITVNGVPPDLIVKPSMADNVESKEEQTEQPEDHHSLRSEKQEDLDLDNVVWNRLPSLTCKLPTTFLATLDTGTSKCMAVAYSNSGLYLACQVGENLCLFSFKGKLSFTMTGHQGLVYCLKWSTDDKHLLSSSADTTACVWDIANRKSTPLQILPHPSYVYSCCWLEDSKGLIATACYDRYVRLWKLGAKLPVQLVLKHTSPVNCIAAIDSGSLASGDNIGAIILWKFDNEGILEFEREITLREVKGKSINKLIVHPGKKRMLIHTRDSVLRMVDIATGSIVQWFRGGFNNRLRCDSCLCGCGSRVFATCEDGSTCCWEAHTGQMIALYTRLQPNNGAASIDYHPRDHYMAIACHSSQGTSTLSIVTYDRDSDGKELGIVYVEPPNQDLEASSQSLNSSVSGSRSNPSLLKDSSYTSSPLTPSPDARKKSKRKEFGIFKALLGRRKTKKAEEEVNITNETVEATESSQRREKRLTTLPITGQDIRDHRLSDIIKRMDKILTAISSNKSAHV